MSCSLLDRGSTPDCENLPIPGTEARLILINWDDVLFIYDGNDTGESGRVWDDTFDQTFGPFISAGTGLGVITSIILKGGRQAYEFLGFRNDVKKSEECEQTSHRKKRFKHACGFVVYEIDQAQKNNLVKMSKGRFIAIVENKGRGDDAFELLGRECGLKIVAGVIRETQGFYQIQLATPDNGIEYERKLPQTFGKSYQDGLEMIEGLLEEPETLTADATDITADSDLITADQTMR